MSAPDGDAVIVRYRVHPDRVEENEALVAAVYEELHNSAQAGVAYATFAMPEGVFVHLARLADPAANPLPGLPAFKRFQSDLGARCLEQPEPRPARLLGSFGTFAP